MLSDVVNEQIFKLIYQNANVSLIGDATGLRGSSTAGSFWISAHTADPTGGDQTTSECSHGGYARVEVDRNNTEWLWDAEGFGYNGIEITFPAVSSGSSTVTHYAVGTASSGAGKLIEVRAANPSILVATPNILTIPVGAFVISLNNP